MSTATVLALMVQLVVAAPAPTRLALGTPQEAFETARSRFAAGDWAAWLACQDPAQTNHVLWNAYRHAHYALVAAKDADEAQGELALILATHDGNPGKSLSWTTSRPDILSSYARVKNKPLVLKEMLDFVEARVGRGALLTGLYAPDASLAQLKVRGAQATAVLGTTGQEVLFIRRRGRWFLTP